MMTSLHRPGTKPPSRLDCVVHAPAKLNLTLAVRGERTDGYHDLHSLVIGLDWGDTVTVTPNPGGGLTLDCAAPDAWRGHVPPAEENLVWKSAALLAKTLGRPAEAAIKLEKEIPPGTGLGGGSSDAAATLLALRRLWTSNLSRNNLSEIGARIGSDVPLFFHLPAAVITGRGENVRPLRTRRQYCVLLILPEIHLSTRAVFAKWHPSRPTAEKTTAAEPDPAHLETLLTQDAEALSAALFNDLEEPAFETAPALRDLFDRVVASGLKGLRMTGSGSCLFHLADDRRQAQDWADQIHKTFNVQTRVTQTLISDHFEQGDFHGHH